MTRRWPRWCAIGSTLHSCTQIGQDLEHGTPVLVLVIRDVIEGGQRHCYCNGMLATLDTRATKQDALATRQDAILASLNKRERMHDRVWVHPADGRWPAGLPYSVAQVWVGPEITALHVAFRMIGEDMHGLVQSLCQELGHGQA